MKRQQLAECVGVSARKASALAFAVCVCVRMVLSVLFAVGAVCAEEKTASDPYQDLRDEMVRQDIGGGSLFGRTAVKDEAVLKAMRTVPRHRFVPPDQLKYAYADHPLPIGYGQTISQPYIVAYMTEMLGLDRDGVALEVGTGSGYQAAVLAAIVKEVYTIEIVPQLASQATKRLEELGYKNVHTRTGDGYFGWKEHAPYDAIIVTAAASHIPPALVEQLKVGGRMAIPVGPPMHVQSLMLVEKQADGTTVQRTVMSVRFVPLTRTDSGDEAASSTNAK